MLKSSVQSSEFIFRPSAESNASYCLIFYWTFCRGIAADFFSLFSDLLQSVLRLEVEYILGPSAECIAAGVAIPAGQ